VEAPSFLPFTLRIVLDKNGQARGGLPLESSTVEYRTTTVRLARVCGREPSKKEKNGQSGGKDIQLRFGICEPL
jgi:hypothetical protein